MNRSAEDKTEWLVAQHLSLATPAKPIWVLEVWCPKDDEKPHHEYHPVLAVRSIIYSVYSGYFHGMRAPHHSELIKAGWTFEGTRHIQDVLYVNPVFDDTGPCASSDYCEINGRILIVGSENEPDAIKHLSKELGWEDLLTKEFAEPESQEAELITSLRFSNRSPVEHSQDLLKLLGYRPNATLGLIMRMLPERDENWIITRLDINGSAFCEQVQQNMICLVNAHALCKLPYHEQANYVDRARLMSPSKFCPMVNYRVAEIRSAKRKKI